MIYGAICLALAGYFTYSAIQGDTGLIRQAEAHARHHELTQELAQVQAEVARMENLTRRLSDDYVDLDLLDQQLRDVLGLVRHDEIVIPH